MTDTTDQSHAPRVDRRTVVAGSAWAVPTILYVGATPAMAASASPCSSNPADYTSTVKTEVTSMPTYSTVTYSGATYRTYTGDGYITFTSTVTYTGPSTLPSGAKLSVAVPSTTGRIITAGTYAVSGPSASLLTLTDPTPVVSGWTAYQEWTTNAPIPAGTQFIITWSMYASALPLGSGVYGSTKFDPPDNVCGTLSPGATRVHQGDEITNVGTTLLVTKTVPFYLARTP